MNTPRILKLKKLNGNFDNLSDKEREFLHMFDDLKQITDKKNIHLIKNNIIYFKYDLENNIFYCNYYKVWKFFENKYTMNYYEINLLTENWLRTHLKLNNVTTDFITFTIWLV